MTGLALAAALVFSSADAHLAYETARELSENHSPRDAGTLRCRLAAQYLYDRINANGPDAKIDKFTAAAPNGSKHFYNIESRYVSHPDNDWIVLMSHYDTKPGVPSQGANDGASTSGLLVALCGAVNAQRPDSINVLFLWTDGEESIVAYGPDDGFWGSRHAAQALKEEKLKISAAVCLDMLGDKNLNITIARNSAIRLKREFAAAARDIGLQDLLKAGKDAVKDDHVAFAECGFDAIDLIDFEYGSAPGLNDYWHTPEDTIDKISENSLLKSGRIAMAFLDRANRKAKKRKEK